MKYIYFDGICNLCNSTVLFLIKRDKNKKFKFASFQSESGQQVLKELHVNEESYKTIIYRSENRLYFKSSAILHILKDLGGLWKIAFACMVIPSFLRNILYMAISRARYRIFGRQQSCMLPTPDIMDRFLP